MRRGKVRMGNHQLQVIIDYMEAHSLFARGQITKLGPQGNKTYQNMWTELASQLNLIGPCRKSIEGWKKTWTRMRLKAKSKKAQFLKAFKKTGHQDPNLELSVEDERISLIFGIHGVGQHVTKELGLPNKSIPIQYPRNYCTNIRKAINKPSGHQMNIMIDFMERHADFARDPTNHESDFWQVLIVLLNSAEGASKNAKMWKRTWTDLVSSARQNMAFMLNGLRDTPISSNHMRVLDLVGQGPEDSTSVDDLFPCKKQKLVDLTNEPCTSSGVYNVPSTSSGIYNVSSTSSGIYNVSSTSSGIYHVPSTSSSFHHVPSTSSGTYHAPSTGLRSTATVPMSTPATRLQSATRQPMNTPAIGFRAASGVRTGGISLRHTPEPATTVTSMKSDQLMKSFQEKGSELVENLANQIVTCFEKYNEMMKECFEKQTHDICQFICQQMPTKHVNEEEIIVAEEESEQMASGTFMDILNDDEDEEEILDEDFFDDK